MKPYDVTMITCMIVCHHYDSYCEEVDFCWCKFGANRVKFLHSRLPRPHICIINNLITRYDVTKMVFVALCHHLIVSTWILNNVDAEFDANHAKNAATTNKSFFT